ncbi:MAG: hypothetical protein ABR589_09740 [Chthoniobacterales bacterium]
MSPENNDTSTENDPESQETTPPTKLRDLKPEKDPMGAGTAAKPQHDDSGFAGSK